VDEIQRLRLLIAAQKDERLQQTLILECKSDPIFWFNAFCWTYDPRPGKGSLPFNLYPFQEDFIRNLVRCVEEGTDTLVEKSRDMGVSWLVLLGFQYLWQFQPSKNFLLGSRKEEYVDKLGDMSTLFQKIRFNLYKQPVWMRPKGFESRRHDGFMKLINPETNNTITGESSNPDFSRSGRYSAILLDEFPKWPFGDPAWGAASQSSPCRIAVGTPYGKGNKFAKLRLGKPEERIKNIITLHWPLHPEKDEAWYENEKTRMTPDEVARELDIDYNLSVGGVVFKEFNGRAHKIETAYKFEPAWETLVTFDFGTTCCCLLIQVDPYDTLHVFKEIILYENGNTEDIGQAYLDYAATLNLRSKIQFYCDPAGNTRDFLRRSMDTHVKALHELGIKPLQFGKAQAMQNRQEQGIQLIRSFLSKRKQGRECIQVYEAGCPTLIEAFQSEYRYKETNKGERLDIIDEKHPWEDVMDCLRYAIIERFSVPKSKTRDVVVAPNLHFGV
jgi:hypothetical protein